MKAAPSHNSKALFSSTCFLCGSDRIAYKFINNGYPVCQCADCGLMFLNPRPEKLEKTGTDTTPFDKAAAFVYLRKLLDYGGFSKGRILNLSGTQYSISSRDFPGISFTDLSNPPGEGSFDACLFVDALQKTANPQETLSAAWDSLRDGGALLLVVPSLSSRVASAAANKWEGFAEGNNYFFDNKSIQSLLFKCGFGDTYLLPDYDYLHLESLRRHYREADGIGKKALSAFVSLAPAGIKNAALKLRHSEIIVLARKRHKRARPLLSIIMPVYNEAATFQQIFSAISAKKIDGIDKEIVIVESNSTDATRELVKARESDPEVRVVYEERPRGKGHAVRTGLKHATGDFFLIQDGDLEYDIGDYEQLLEPLLNYRYPFVLGSRHAKGWKMRHFEDQPMVSFVMNMGQSFFVTLLNLFCGTRMNDPFTMYKLFRRDCLTGLEFKANRFDFDWEIVIKFIRKGYIPLELPVNYNSRSFSEGKKVSFIKDPILWMIALLRFRFCRLYDRTF